MGQCNSSKDCQVKCHNNLCIGILNQGGGNQPTQGWEAGEQNGNEPLAETSAHSHSGNPQVGIMFGLNLWVILENESPFYLCYFTLDDSKDGFIFYLDKLTRVLHQQ